MTTSSFPTFRVASRLFALRGLVVFCVTALIAAAFLIDVSGGARRAPRTDQVERAAPLT